MIKNIYVKSVCDNGKLIDGIIFSVSNGKVNIYSDSIVVELTDDGNITIPSGNYELLQIETNCGDFKIDLPTLFKKKGLKKGRDFLQEKYENFKYDITKKEYVDSINAISEIICPKEYAKFQKKKQM